ncbi:Gfo/Idh/MocA family oxidoreductase [Roseiconus nitratireducens]|uniref:Gfo/Idh/MocA family oxidoreductase n=1 Tax=Roseiconus nitratireducens TaxID=2605748 RepID=A0A5M6DES6_9BACT|nr:Gfo/Idh/MocA family oxidoreductase [Roseiconus nitratireducens]KAA5546061.1 Gfo/Idh/MocA family oxidoreductase [Roseiconus nitratireducens]
MRFGVIGTGRITRRLVADLQSTDGVTVSAIASRTAERARWFASQYGIAASVEGYQALIDREDVDAVYIALPPSMHTQWCVKAAEAGKHVLCEKPLATSLEQGDQMARACDQASVRWLDATGWLHHGRTIKMLDLVNAGLLGTPTHFTASVSFYRPFQSDEHRLDASLGGGCLLDLGWYAAGAACRFVGEAPQRVFADWQLENGVPIRTTAILWFNNNVTASVSCGYDTATRKWFEFAGSEASIICDDFTRPWADRPPRFWVHQAHGEVQSHEVADRQEQRMIRTLVGEESLADYNRHALATQGTLDALAASAASGRPVSLAPSPSPE